MKVYQSLASKIGAIANCEKSGNTQWQAKHVDAIEKLTREYLPSGSGFDSGSKIDLEKSTPDKLVIRADFHHMDENGFYCGWSEHQVIVTASLQFGFALRVTGRNTRNIKDYISDTFHHALGVSPSAD